MAEKNGKVITYVKIAALILTLIGMCTAGSYSYGALSTKVKSNTAKIGTIPTQVAVIQNDVKNIKEDFAEFKIEQTTMGDGIDELLRR